MLNERAAQQSYNRAAGIGGYVDPKAQEAIDTGLLQKNLGEAAKASAAGQMDRVNYENQLRTGFENEYLNKHADYYTLGPKDPKTGKQARQVEDWVRAGITAAMAEADPNETPAQTKKRVEEYVGYMKKDPNLVAYMNDYQGFIQC